MKRIKWLFNLRNIYLILIFYFFSGYFYPNYLKQDGIYIYIDEYLGIYRNLLWFCLAVYGFSFFMKNPQKKMVLRTRMIFFVILGASTGYLYLLNSLKNIGDVPFDIIKRHIVDEGLLNINLGYMEIYTFLEIESRLEKKVFVGILIFLIFISLIMICGKMIHTFILVIINIFRNFIRDIKNKKQLKREREALEKQKKLEKDIYDEIVGIQELYREKNRKIDIEATEDIGSIKEEIEIENENENFVQNEGSVESKTIVESEKLVEGEKLIENKELKNRNESFEEEVQNNIEHIQSSSEKEILLLEYIPLEVSIEEEKKRMLNIEQEEYSLDTKFQYSKNKELDDRMEVLKREIVKLKRDKIEEK